MLVFIVTGGAGHAILRARRGRAVKDSPGGASRRRGCIARCVSTRARQCPAVGAPTSRGGEIGQCRAAGCRCSPARRTPRRRAGSALAPALLEPVAITASRARRTSGGRWTASGPARRRSAGIPGLQHCGPVRCRSPRWSPPGVAATRPAAGPGVVGCPPGFAAFCETLLRGFAWCGHPPGGEGGNHGVEDRGCLPSPGQQRLDRAGKFSPREEVPPIERSTVLTNWHS